MSHPHHKQTIEELARQLPRHTPSASLRERTLSALPDREVTSPPATTRRAFVITGALAIAGTLGVFAGPRLLSVGTASLAASDVRAALQRVNTWHLTGWKLKNGKRVRWEVWGRRTPYFYRETVGGNITFDDGKTHVSLLPTVPQNIRNQPVALYMFSEKLVHQSDFPVHKTTESNGITSVEAISSAAYTSPDSFLENHASTGNFEVIGSSPEEIRLRCGHEKVFGGNRQTLTQLLTVSRATKLPRTFTWHVDRTPSSKTSPGANAFPPQSFDSSYLEATYDGPVEMQATPLPVNALVYDLTALSDGQVPTVNATTSHGLTVQATNITRDDNNILRVVFGVWLGNRRLVSRSSGLDVTLYYQQIKRPTRVHGNKPEITILPTVWDDQNRAYVEIISPASSDRSEHYFAPVEPIAQDAIPPRTLFMRVSTALESYEYNAETRSVQGVTLRRSRLDMKMGLPEVTNHIDYKQVTKEDWTLAEAVTSQRAEYYHSAAMGSPSALERARFWYEEAARLGERNQHKLLQDLCRANIEGLDRIKQRNKTRE